ncbi:hypothetical protein D9K79_04015 [Acinetobacter cumulans]|jgi:uncharacterized lipoprotein NlpE involved in copper resistance|uniref:Copper resistance protein NlpE n=1 Tax=Acinetobacter cumulans TaxID=2136182 RepID=A0ABX9U9I5_9GAMM|nr:MULTISPECIES: copper resistance protein NlpE N-terminal domain-containing protein [Acinetobacter]RFS29840.1 hypothetical protein DYI81_11545 [Acinetobacter sp. SWAC5]RKG46677.1 hypothetical protein D7V51_00410 [Acinetobacter cumulans]RLL48861.1 hypothetical protein D9K79_04015 [Acinetobacter cumulans]RZG62071.1 hypothetical protein EXE29_00410 [Acinetobacter sp. WCHAc060006]
MNKSILIPLVSLSSLTVTGLVGCERASETTVKQTEAVQVKHIVPAWVGSYSGHTPCMSCSALCEDCEGMAVKLTLNADMTYTLDRQSMSGNDQPALLHGAMKFHNPEKTKLELVNVESRNLLYVNLANKQLEILKNDTAQPYDAQDNFLLERA